MFGTSAARFGRLAASAALRRSSASLMIATIRRSRVGRDRQRAGRIAMRPDPFERIGAVLHQHAHHLRVAVEHGVVQRPVPVVLRHVHVHELGARGEHGANLRDVAPADRVRQTRNRHTVHVRLQLGPAVEAVRAWITSWAS